MVQEQVRQLKTVQPAEMAVVIQKAKQATEASIEKAPSLAASAEKTIERYRDRNLDKLVVTR